MLGRASLDPSIGPAANSREPQASTESGEATTAALGHPVYGLGRPRPQQAQLLVAADRDDVNALIKANAGSPDVEFLEVISLGCPLGELDTAALLASGANDDARSARTTYQQLADRVDAVESPKR